MLTLSENAKLLSELDSERRSILEESNDLTEQMLVLQQSHIRQMRSLSNRQLGLLEKMVKIDETSSELLKCLIK